MRKLLIAILTVATACTGFADTFVPLTGDWNVATNWSGGVVPGVGIDAFITGKIATIQTGNAGSVRRTNVNGGGTLIVNGSLDNAWVGNGLAVGFSGGAGTVQVMGGAVSSAGTRRDLMIGSTNSVANYGTFQLGNEATGGTAYFNNVYVTANAASLSLIDLQSGTMDVGSILSLGKTGGTTNSVRMVLGGTATLNALNLNVGVTADVTKARLDVNGSEVTVTAGNMSLVNGCQINLNFDDSGISTLVATKLWYGNAVVINVNGTANVNPGSYPLFIGTNGGTTNGTLAFNISGFNGAYTTEVVKTIDGGTSMLTYTLNVTGNVTPEQAILSAFMSNSVFYVSSTNLAATGTNYLQASSDLVFGGWSNVSSAVGTSSTNWPVAPALASEFFRVLWQ